MFSRYIIWFVCGAAVTGTVVGQDDFQAKIKPMMREYCERCHGGQDEGAEAEINGDVNLSVIRDERMLLRDPDLLQRLVEVVEFHEMPPEDERQPTKAERRQLTQALETLLKQSVVLDNHVGHTPVRRMNRLQYNNAVTDLFELDCVVFTLTERMMREHSDYFKPASGVMPNSVRVGSRPLGKSQLIESRLAGVAAFPQDLRAEHGFDNRGDHLSLSPLLMEAFLKLGQSITQSKDFTRKRVGIWDEFFASPADEQPPDEAIHQRLSWFLPRAFRGPAEDGLIERYASFASAQIDQGADFTEAMKAVAAATIASPKFLYLYDLASQRDSRDAQNDFELASRLSFFLWGSIPDEELVELARAGQLNDSDVLAAQVDRMLRDPKLKRFCDSFPAQWLQLERIVASLPNPERFPSFYFSQYRTSMHMMIEPLLLFETVLIENRPITQLIDPDFTYRSKTLSEAYGNVVSEVGRQVTALTFDRLPVSDRRHGGVITNAAVMTMTSAPDRTQPITRGAWVATVIFNDPPDPPPANVPPLPEKAEAGQEHLTLRERLADHRERADCRGCHEQIDPLGFALENYNPIGVWRDKYENGQAIDVTGKLFRQHRFDDVIEFKDAILAEQDRFAAGFTGHLLSFALARELEPADSIAIDNIVEVAAANNYRMQTLIKQIVLSQPFRSKATSTQHIAADDKR